MIKNDKKFTFCTKFVDNETNDVFLHKMLKKKAFRLPRKVRKELAEFERADLEDAKRSDGRI